MMTKLSSLLASALCACLFLAIVPLAVAAPESAGPGCFPRPSRGTSEAGPPADLSADAWIRIVEQIRKAQYHLTPTERTNREESSVTWVAANRAHALEISFTAEGIRFHPAGEIVSSWHWGMELVGYGREDEILPVSSAEPVAERNRVEYRRGSLTEWYVNDRRGVEQGFTLQEPPQGDSRGRVVLELSLSGSLLPQVNEKGSSMVLLNEGGAARLRYGNLHTFDAEGRELGTWLALRDPAAGNGPGRLAILVDATDAVYPLTIDPLITTEVAKLIASDAAGHDSFGSSAAVSGDTVVVGAPWDDDAGHWSGSAYVFQRNWGGADNWGEVRKLTASDAEGRDEFGDFVAISGDTVVVGVRLDDDANSESGSAYVFERNWGGADNWGEVRKLTASDARYRDWFGASVAVSGDTVVVGAPGDDDDRIDSGSAYVFERNRGGADNWGEARKFNPAKRRREDDQFGWSVAISGDTVFVGAHRNDDAGTNSGSVYIFERNRDGADQWGQLPRLNASDAAEGDSFGFPVAISGDTLIVGAVGSGDAGAVYVFERNQGGADAWGQVRKLTTSDVAAGDGFGLSAAISGDAVVVGAYNKSDPWLESGSAYVFERNEGGADNWGERQKLAASDAGAVDWFGFSVGISNDTVIVGASADSAWGISSGSAYVFLLNQPPVALCTDVTTTAGPMTCVADASVDDGSFDPDDDPLILTQNPPGPYNLGETHVTLTVEDSGGSVSSCEARVTVIDATPPEIQLDLDPTVLWPPNHHMVKIRATAVAADSCGEPSIARTTIASDEPEDGDGDGDTSPDMEGGTSEFSFWLRAERSGMGDGRTYSVSYTATDSSGNETTATSIVQVPHSQGGLTDPLWLSVEDTPLGTVVRWNEIDDAQSYSVIRGRLSGLVETASTIDLGPLVCIEERSLDTDNENSEDSLVPSVGEGFFYLAEYQARGNSSYGSESVAKPREPGSGACK